MDIQNNQEPQRVTRVESFEIEKEKPLNNELTVEKREVIPSVVVNPTEEAAPVKYLSLSQFSVTLIKNITGAGVLCTPYAIKNMGIIGTILVFTLLVIGNVWCSHLLIHVTQYCKKHQSNYPPKEVGNDYAVIIYHILGPAGYFIFVCLYLIAIWGVQVATLISIVDFIARLPISAGFFADTTMKRLFFHILTTSICLLLVLMHDIRPIVAAASLSIFALIISFIILLVFGFIRYGISFDSSFWAPASATAFLSSIGIPSYSLGYNFSFLSFFKELSNSNKEKAGKVTVKTISITTFFMVVLPMIALFSYSGKEGGISQNILLMIPSNEVIAIIVNIMMFLSCLFSYPIYSPPLNEVLEASVKNTKTTGIFVSDSKRLLLRIAQTLIISLIAWFLPNFGDIVSLVGGFVFTAISLVIPPFLHVRCKDITKGQKVLDTVGCVVFTIFMLVSTVFSAIVLIQNSK